MIRFRYESIFYDVALMFWLQRCTGGAFGSRRHRRDAAAVAKRRVGALAPPGGETRETTQQFDSTSAANGIVESLI